MMRWSMMVLWCFHNVAWGQFPENPCPDIFSYKEEKGIHYGEISIPFAGSTEGTKGLNLSVNISARGHYQNAKLKLELLTPIEGISSASALKYKVNFPTQQVIPKITRITFNAKSYCDGPAEPVTTGVVTNLEANLYHKVEGTGFVKNSSEPLNNATISQKETPSYNTNHESCGIQKLVRRGNRTVGNEFPWLVALFHKRSEGYAFQCVATLITRRHVLTAAHCVRYYKGPLAANEDILLVLGRANLSRWTSTSALQRLALEVIHHPNYEQSAAPHDLAIIKLNEDVPVTSRVRPICLWDFGPNLNGLVGTYGTVAGWGETEDHVKGASIARKVSMPIVSEEDCLRSHPAFRQITGRSTFCAGSRDGSGPCKGDSGAGFYMNRAEKWYLRGLVSRVVDNQDFSCNLHEYVVFTDVAIMKDWINSVVMEK